MNDSAGNGHECCAPDKGHAHRLPGFDWLLWLSLAAVLAGMGLSWLAGGGHDAAPVWGQWGHAVMDFVSAVAPGLAMGVVAVGVMGFAPKSWFRRMLGRGGGVSGVLRATMAGVLLDTCSHGILLVAMQLYRKGVSLGQVFAFLIASPWNSLSLVFILASMIGVGWTAIFILASMVIAVVAGCLVEVLVRRGVLPGSPYALESDDAEGCVPRPAHWWLWPQAVLVSGLAESRMILRWLLFGIVLAASVRAFVPTEWMEIGMGPTLLGLLVTLVAATVIEVCSEGSAPLAAEIFQRAAAPGNAFAFLMAGAATDYTEVVALKETTGSWKVAFFLPLLTVPQVVLLAWLMNRG